MNEGDKAEYSQQSIIALLKDPMFLMLFIGLIIIAIATFVKGWMGYVEYSKSSVLGVGIIIFVMFIKGMQYFFKVYSPVIVWQNGKTTTSGQMETTGSWNGHYMGGIKTQFKGVHWPGREGSVFHPVNAVNYIGKDGLVILGTGEKKPFDALERDVQSMIIRYNMPAPYIIIYASEEQMLEKHQDIGEITKLKMPDTSWLLNHIDALNRYRTAIEEMMRGKFDAVQDVMSALKRIESKMKRDNITDKLKDQLARKQEA